MASIREVKTNLRHREWEEQIRECQSSGMKVRDWCKTNGLNETTYYRRLRIIREEYLQSGGNSAHQIVSVGVSNEIRRRQQRDCGSNFQSDLIGKAG